MAAFLAELRRVMDQRELGVRKLGQAAGVDPSTIAKVLRGDRRPSTAQAVAIVHALGLSRAESRRLLLLAAAEHGPKGLRAWVEGLAGK